MRSFSSRRDNDERGASLVEYALLLACIAIVCIGAVSFLGNQPKKPLNTVGSSLSAAS